MSNEVFAKIKWYIDNEIDRSYMNISTITFTIRYIFTKQTNNAVIIQDIISNEMIESNPHLLYTLQNDYNIFINKQNAVNELYYLINIISALGDKNHCSDIKLTKSCHGKRKCRDCSKCNHDHNNYSIKMFNNMTSYITGCRNIDQIQNLCTIAHLIFSQTSNNDVIINHFAINLINLDTSFNTLSDSEEYNLIDRDLIYTYFSNIRQYNVSFIRSDCYIQVRNVDFFPSRHQAVLIECDVKKGLLIGTIKFKFFKTGSILITCKDFNIASIAPEYLKHILKEYNDICNISKEIYDRVNCQKGKQIEFLKIDLIVFNSNIPLLNNTSLQDILMTRITNEYFHSMRNTSIEWNDKEGFVTVHFNIQNESSELQLDKIQIEETSNIFIELNNVIVNNLNGNWVIVHNSYRLYRFVEAEFTNMYSKKTLMCSVIYWASRLSDDDMERTYICDILSSDSKNVLQCIGAISVTYKLSFLNLEGIRMKKLRSLVASSELNMHSIDTFVKKNIDSLNTLKWTTQLYKNLINYFIKKKTVSKYNINDFLKGVTS